MKATIYGKTKSNKEYKKELVVTDYGSDWFEYEFVGGWKLIRDLNDGFILVSPAFKFMAIDCSIELS